MMDIMEVVKSGRRTDITYGQITAIEGAAKLHYDGVVRVIRDVITIDQRSPYEEVSAGGDSGAWWMESVSHRVVGLHFAGGNSPERALANNIHAVCEALDIKIVI